MAMTNHGFNGTVDEAAWARMMRIGSAEGVDGSAAWAVTQGSGRQVSVAAQSGWAFACGVESQETGALTSNLSTPTNGQWFLIVRRIDWASDTVTIANVAHTTTTTTAPTFPPGTFPTINQNPGVLYDQPLAWAWVRSTDTTMVLFDLRALPLKDRLATRTALLTRAAVQGITNGTDTTISWDASPAQIGGFSYSSGVLTVPNTGLYMFSFRGMWVGNGSATGVVRRLYVTRNGTTERVFDNHVVATAATADHAMSTSGLLALTAGDTIQFRVIHNGGVTLNIGPLTSGEFSCRVHLVGALI